MKKGSKRNWPAMVAALALATVLAGVVVAAGGKAPVMVFTNDGPQGKVWVNVDLTRRRLTEPYVPMIVAILNNDAKPILLDRNALRLIDADGQEIPMATLREVRSGYKKLNFDWRTLNAQGMPFGTRLGADKYVQSRFFPTMSGGGAIAIDHVQIPPSYWTVDLFYFKRPGGLAEGRPVLLEAAPKGWKEPIRVKIQL
ncbi:MAG TPA: hypothetical protein ENK19_01260 [Acidobacteria bacterium]|nr:hypothetical protein [Acidobacteriota bacterium]